MGKAEGIVGISSNNNDGSWNCRIDQMDIFDRLIGRRFGRDLELVFFVFFYAFLGFIGLLVMVQVYWFLDGVWKGIQIGLDHIG